MNATASKMISPPPPILHMFNGHFWKEAIPRHIFGARTIFVLVLLQQLAGAQAAPKGRLHEFY